MLEFMLMMPESVVRYFHKVVCESFGYEPRTKFKLCRTVSRFEDLDLSGYGTYVECGRCGFLLEGTRE